MIVKTIVVTIIFSIGIVRGVTGASYSNVYVERDIVPRGYYRYAPYTSLSDPRISQITSLPAITEYGAPCGSPCVFPAQAVPSVVAPVNPSPNVIAYSAPVPSVPVLVTPPKEAANGYEYSYAVYDESTGDHKAQRELSDGSVVRGEYSFIQPDGYVREVQYVADDISGFNAVVKKFLPVTVEGKKKVESVVKIESTPPLNVDCHEIKSESIKQASNEKSEAITEHEELPKEGSVENSKEIHNEHVTQPMSEEEPKDSSNENHSLEDHSKEEKHSKEESVEKTEDKSKEVQDIKSEPSEEQSSDGSAEKSKENLQLEPELPKEESSEKSKQENSHSKESGLKSEEKEDITTKPTSSVSGEESVSKESKEELKEISTIHSGEKINDNKHKEIFDLLQPPQEAVVPYHDIIRCIQAAMRRSYGVPSAVNEEHSPLTYIVLNKPC